jgi:hypothetical protein
MTPLHAPGTKGHNAVFVYVLVILGLQIFLLVVALEAFQSDDEGLAWPAAPWLSGRPVGPGARTSRARSAATWLPSCSGSPSASASRP